MGLYGNLGVGGTKNALLAANSRLEAYLWSQMKGVSCRQFLGNFQAHVNYGLVKKDNKN